MIHVMATFRVKPDKLQDVKAAIDSLVEAVRDKEPDCVLYESFQGEDENSFVHLMSFDNDRAEEEHRKADHTRQFHQLLESTCEDGPIFARLNLFRTTEG